MAWKNEIICFRFVFDVNSGDCSDFGRISDSLEIAMGTTHSEVLATVRPVFVAGYASLSDEYNCSTVACTVDVSHSVEAGVPVLNVI